MIGVGNLLGVFLILRRHQAAPVYFSLYLPFIVLLYLLDPDPVATANARLASIGAEPDFTANHLAVILTLNVVLVAGCVAYWSRSKRVKAVFGTTGLALLRRSQS